MQVKDDKELSKKYNEFVKSVTKENNMWIDMFWAFIVGGIICSIGQMIGDILKNYGVGEEHANSITLLILIFLSAFLTGLNIYPKIGKLGGVGALVPITGFANSVAAPAIEFRAEGMVMGLGCKIFTIAGPVILYGTLSSWLLGIIYWITTLF